jgi:hypothetical protein
VLSGATITLYSSRSEPEGHRPLGGPWIDLSGSVNFDGEKTANYKSQVNNILKLFLSVIGFLCNKSII